MTTLGDEIRSRPIPLAFLGNSILADGHNSCGTLLPAMMPWLAKQRKGLAFFDRVFHCGHAQETRRMQRTMIKGQQSEFL